MENCRRWILNQTALATVVDALFYDRKDSTIVIDWRTQCKFVMYENQLDNNPVTQRVGCCGKQRNDPQKHS